MPDQKKLSEEQLTPLAHNACIMVLISTRTPRWMEGDILIGPWSINIQRFSNSDGVSEAMTHASEKQRWKRLLGICITESGSDS